MCDWDDTKVISVNNSKGILCKVDVDSCIADLVKALNDAGMYTVASCCGHGKQPMSIILEGDQELRRFTYEQARIVDRYFPCINPPPKLTCSNCDSDVLCPRCNS